jgi:putative spermidine/putrescine transport system ATP-binding protein
VFNEGKIIQVDSPAHIYEKPQSRFVADFVGSSNVLPPDFASSHGCAAKWTSLRPERIAVAAPGTAVSNAHSYADGEVKLISYQGAVTRYSVQAGDRRIAAEVPAGAEFKEGDKVRLVWPKSAMVAMEEGA